MMAEEKKGMLSLITVLFWMTLGGLMVVLEEVKMETMAEEQIVDPSQEHTLDDLVNDEAAHRDQVKYNPAGRMQHRSASLPAFDVAVVKTGVTTTIPNNVLTTIKINKIPDSVTTVPNNVLTTSATTTTTVIPDVLTTTAPVEEGRSDWSSSSHLQLVTPLILRPETTPVSKLRSVTTKPPVSTTTPTGDVAVKSDFPTEASGSNHVCNLTQQDQNEQEVTNRKAAPKPLFGPIRPGPGSNTGPISPRAGRPLPIEDRLWDAAMQNSWYKWALYTTREMTPNDCIVCAQAPGMLPEVVPEKYTSSECAITQRRTCKTRKEIEINKKIPPILKLPLCGFHCRLLHGTRDKHKYVKKYAEYNILEECAEFAIQTDQNGPPTDYKIDYSADYECFASGGFADNGGVDVGNTSVNCNVTWVLSWFPHANMTPLLIDTPVWYENPVTLSQDCENISMTIPTLDLIGEQDIPVADSYWMCGGDVLMNVLPSFWVGLCTLVRMKVPVTILHEGVSELLQLETTNRRRTKRYDVFDHKVHLNAIGLPTGIPIEFQARDEVVAGLESILPWITINKNVKWINYVYFNQQRILNYTVNNLGLLGEQLHATVKMTLQHDQALDWLLAEKGGLCKFLNSSGQECCTYIPSNTAPDGAFTEGMRKLKDLKIELRENAGRESWSLDSLALKLGQWGAILVKAGISAIVVLILISLLACCILPVVRRLWERTLAAQMNLAASSQYVQMEMAAMDSARHPMCLKNGTADEMAVE
nr:uncharacterized protein LOC129163912 [Nothobranchius furzeri]